MDIRRLLLFLTVSFAFLYFWTTFVVRQVPKQQPQVGLEQREDDVADQPDDTPAVAEGDVAADAAAEVPMPAVHHAQLVVLGSLDPADGYAAEVKLTTAGAAIESVRLANPRLKDLKDRAQQVQVLGNNSTADRTFSTGVDLIEQQLARHNSSLESINWEIRRKDRDSVMFAFTAPDQTLEVAKTYSVTRLDFDSRPTEEALRNDSRGYTIQCELMVRNLSDKAQEVQYEVLGPCGVILENEEHTRKYRDIKLEFLGDESSDIRSATAIRDTWEEYRSADPRRSDQDIERLVRESDRKWIEPFRYAAVDVQFFAAIVAPLDERSVEQQMKDKWIERTWPVMIEEFRNPAYLTDISFRMASVPRKLAPAGQSGDTLTHSYAIFVGPKYGGLLDPPPFEAEKVLDYGTYFGFIARGMHSVLSFLYGIGLPYWLAIISLTIMVRGCLFPLSRKQAISAARMKELQPKINELKLKFGDDKEKLSRAQMELWRKHDINPLGGCLPLFFQFPVFIGLYTCLNTAVDLRLSSFLWIDNLAAPDALFRLPFTLPILGQDFNVLPCINVVMFLVQQKLFMPPPVDEQTAMQHKMMNIMTIFFAVMFWHVPAGLCIYFVASSLWSIAERLLLATDKLGKKVSSEQAEDESEPAAGKNSEKKNGAKRKSGTGSRRRGKQGGAERSKGFLQRLMEAAEAAKEKAEKSKSAGEKSRRKRR